MIIAGENLLHHPRGAQGALAGADTAPLAEQLIHNLLDQRLLHMWRVGDIECLAAGGGLQDDGLRGEGGEGHISF